MRSAKKTSHKQTTCLFVVASSSQPAVSSHVLATKITLIRSFKRIIRDELKKNTFINILCVKWFYSKNNFLYQFISDKLNNK